MYLNEISRKGRRNGSSNKSESVELGQKKTSGNLIKETASSGPISHAIKQGASSGTAPGPSPLRFSHLRLFQPTGDGPHPLSWLLHHIAAGYIHHQVQPLLADAELIPLSKGCSDVRPIAVGDTIRRLVGKTTCKTLKPKLKSLFAPSQRALASGGREIVIHSIRQKEHLCDVVVSADIKLF